MIMYVFIYFIYLLYRIQLDEVSSSVIERQLFSSFIAVHTSVHTITDMTEF